MRDTSLLQLALGLAPPWTVSRADFDAEAHRLDIQIDFAPGSRFACPTCGAAACPAYDTARKTWRHLNFFQHQAYLTARAAHSLRDLRHQDRQRAMVPPRQRLHPAVRSVGHDHGFGHAGGRRGPHRR
jgi:transposase